MLTRRLFALLLALLAPSPVWAGPGTGPAVSTPPPVAEPRTAVFVAHAGSDTAGSLFVKGLKRGLQQSTAFRLAAREDDAHLVLVVVSVSPASGAATASAVSLAYVANNAWRSLLGSAARFVGVDRAEAMGGAAVGELAAVVAAYDPTASPPR